MLLTLAEALGFGLPGPHRKLREDQIRTFWTRALRTGGPQYCCWPDYPHPERRFWWTWPPESPRTTEPRLRARSTYDRAGPREAVDTGRMEAWIVLLHEVLLRRAARGEGPLPPTELTAEASRLLLGDLVRLCETPGTA